MVLLVQIKKDVTKTHEIDANPNFRDSRSNPN